MSVDLLSPPSIIQPVYSEMHLMFWVIDCQNLLSFPTCAVLHKSTKPRWDEPMGMLLTSVRGGGWTEENMSDGTCDRRDLANERERGRMRSLNLAYTRLKNKLPWIPQDTKLTKLNILLEAMRYIKHLMAQLACTDKSGKTQGQTAGFIFDSKAHWNVHCFSLVGHLVAGKNFLDCAWSLVGQICGVKYDFATICNRHFVTSKFTNFQWPAALLAHVK